MKAAAGQTVGGCVVFCHVGAKGSRCITMGFQWVQNPYKQPAVQTEQHVYWECPIQAALPRSNMINAGPKIAQNNSNANKITQYVVSVNIITHYILQTFYGWHIRTYLYASAQHRFRSLVYKKTSIYRLTLPLKCYNI